MEAAADGSTAVAKAENPYEVPVELPVQRYAKEIAQSVRDNPVTVSIASPDAQHERHFSYSVCTTAQRMD